MKLAFDVETSRFPDGSPFRPDNILVSWAVHSPEHRATGYYMDADFLSELRAQIASATTLILINGKFDLHWCKRHGIEVPKGCRIWDCQVAEYVLSGQTNSFASMEELCDRYGITGKEGGLEEWWGQGIETKDIPVDIVLDYNSGDVSRTWDIYQRQLSDSRMTPELNKLILLQGADLLVLQKMEWNGLKYDVDRSLEEGEKLNKELVEISAELDSYTDYTVGFNWDSGDHLSAFLYGGVVVIDIATPVDGVYKSGPRKGEAYTQNKWSTEEHRFERLFKPLPRSEVAKSTPEKPLYQTSEPVLKQLRCTNKKQRRVIELLLKRAELEKLVNTYFFKLPERITEMGWTDNIIHGQYNQVVARTGRLSSSAPNMQNNPEVVDQMFISRYAD